jgi:hypothetical protein
MGWLTSGMCASGVCASDVGASGVCGMSVVFVEDLLNLVLDLVDDVGHDDLFCLG